MIKIEILSDRPQGPIVLDLRRNDESNTHIAANEYTLKESSLCTTRITFRVHNDVVLGLKLCTVVKKALVTMDKSEEVLGTFAPTVEEHVVSLTPETTPSGYFARGSFTGKTLFMDCEGMVHMQYSFAF